MASFEDLGLSEQTLKVIQKKGFEEPTPIQEKTIPAILTGTKDIVGQAQTGTGKTAAFGLPIIELLPDISRSVQALVLTPTRELAIQVAEEINSLKGKRKLNIIPIYGGQSMELQLRSLKKGVDIVVGTPGRIIDHLKRKTLKLNRISYMVLDEADEMLNMGFLDDVREIMDATPEGKRTMLFSATMPTEILQIAKKYMGEYDVLKVTKGQLTVKQTDQIYFEVSAADKFEALCRIIDMEEEFYGLVFCRTKVDVDQISNRLIERGYDADALHGDMSQSLRERILGKFKKGMLNILVATDVAARGIDVQDLTHVINFALPQDPESYVHRIGRTGRAGKEGIAITFITPSEYRKLQFIQRHAKTDIRKAKIPRVKEVIKAKKRRIRSDLKEIATTYLENEYIDMSRELLDTYEPEQIVAALLQYSFQEELDEKSYTEIADAVVDNKGKTRLFVTQGKKDGLSRKKLEEFIRDKSGIASNRIRDIHILDKFSFVTLPFNEAEILLSHFKKKTKGAGPFITKATKAKRSRK
ncbi:MAG: DEAD/DEAH box helicase [Nitrospiraceae bacterium]|nr:MAG: DEAD/DEAH box helicase [Nitrospiraceae bacterium]